MNEVKKIDVHFEDGSKKTLNSQAVAVWIEGNDVEMNFCDMDTQDIPLLLKAIQKALKVAEQQAKMFEKKE